MMAQSRMPSQDTEKTGQPNQSLLFQELMLKLKLLEEEALEALTFCDTHAKLAAWRRRYITGGGNSNG